MLSIGNEDLQLPVLQGLAGTCWMVHPQLELYALHTTPWPTWQLYSRLQNESCEYIGEELVGVLAIPVAGLGNGSTHGSTRKEIMR